MHITPLLFICVCLSASAAKQTAVYAGDISAGNYTKVYVGDTVELKCSRSHEFATHNWYLCKDGEKIKMLPGAGQDFFYNLTDVTAKDSGNYSCVYSETKYKSSEACSKDAASEKTIAILIHDHEIAAANWLWFLFVILLVVLLALVGFLHNRMKAKHGAKDSQTKRDQRETAEESVDYADINKAKPDKGNKRQKSEPEELETYSAVTHIKGAKSMKRVRHDDEMETTYSDIRVVAPNSRASQMGR